MNAARARSTARYSGLVLVVLMVFALLWMQKTLVTLKGQKGGRLGSAVRVLEVRAAEPAKAAAELFGADVSIAASADLDGDGSAELLCVRRVPPAIPSETWVTRAAVVSPRGPGKWALLLDSQLYVPPGTDAHVWRAERLAPASIALEAIGADGRASGHRVEFEWSAAEKTYLSRETRGAAAVAPVATSPAATAATAPAATATSMASTSPATLPLVARSPTPGPAATPGGASASAAAGSPGVPR